MLIEGKNPVKEALRAGTPISKLYIQKGLHGTEDILKTAKEMQIRLVFCERQALDKLSETKKHQGLIAITEEFKYCGLGDITDFARQKGEKLFMLILDGIEDPHNLGSIIRAAECAGVHGIVIPDRRSATVNETVIRTSAGATAHMRIALVGNINDAIRKLKDDFINIYAADMNGVCVYETDLKQDMAIVIGSEGFGVKELTRKLSDRIISLPQKGQINSLNASVATGIIVYEAVRQRQTSV